MVTSFRGLGGLYECKMTKSKPLFLTEQMFILTITTSDLGERVRHGPTSRRNDLLFEPSPMPVGSYSLLPLEFESAMRCIH